MNVYFGLEKNGKTVLHQPSDRRLWEDFINGKSNNIPDVVIDSTNEFFEHFKSGLTVESCSEFHFWDFETGIEKICYNLSDEVLTWETKNIK